MLKKIILLTTLSYTLLFSETLLNVTNEIIHTNPELQEKIHYYNSLREDYKYSKMANLPKIDFALDFGQEYTNSPSTNNKGVDLTKTTSSLQLVQNIFSGFKTSNDIAQRRAKFISASFSVLEKTNSLALSVAKTYLNILKYSRLVELSKKNIKVYEKILTQIEEKVNSGFSPKSDMLQIQTRYTLAQSNLISQKESLENELTTFHRLLGRFVDKSEFQDPHANFIVPQSIDQATKIALNEHPAIKMANYNVQAKKSAYEKEKNRYLPTVDFVARAEKNNNTSAVKGDTDRYYAGVQLKYNLFNGLGDRAVIQKNISLIQEENAIRTKVRRQIIESVRSAWNSYNSLLKKDTILREHVDYANQTKESYNQEFMIGKRSLLDLLNIENEYNSAEQALNENYYTMLYTKYQLLDSMGTLSEKLGVSIKEKIDSEDYRDGERSHYIKDTLPLNLEVDGDNIVDMKDICDRSLKNSDVNIYGCREKKQTQTLVVQNPPAPPRPPVHKVEPLKVLQQPIRVPATPVNIVEPPVALVAPTVIPTASEEDLMVAQEMQKEASRRAQIEKNGTPQEKEQEKKKRSLEKHTIYFDYKSSTIALRSQDTLNDVVAIMNEQEDVNLKLFGYTDNKGSKKYNKKLSLERAKIVKDYLIERGIEEERIFTYGRGESNPIATNNTNSGRKKNRRVEFLFTQDTNKDITTSTPLEIETPKIVQEVKKGPYWTIRISSYGKERNAKSGANRLEHYINRSAKLSSLQEKLHFKATFRKSGNYYMSMIKPIVDKTQARRVLRLIQKKWPNSYLRKEIGEITVKKELTSRTIKEKPVVRKKRVVKITKTKKVHKSKPVTKVKHLISKQSTHKKEPKDVPSIQDDFDTLMIDNSGSTEPSDTDIENMDLDKIDVDF